MRQLGHLKDEATAQAFSDYLYVQGVTNEVEADSGGWVIWVHEEEQIPKAQELLQAFLANPSDPKYYQHSREAQRLKEREEQEEREAERRHFDRRRVFRGGFGGGVGAFTFALIAVSVSVYILMQTGSRRAILEAMLISTAVNGLPEVMDGQVWRLITPILMHGGLLHLFFNMLWLFDLGSMIERRQGPGFFMLFVAVTAVLSNLGEWLWTGPLFYGMSGVVYGLLGYIWMKGKYDPASGLFLHQQTVTMMLIWYFLCVFQVIPNVANAAHTVGLVAGIAWGYLASQRK